MIFIVVFSWQSGVCQLEKKKLRVPSCPPRRPQDFPFGAFSTVCLRYPPIYWSTVGRFWCRMTSLPSHVRKKSMVTNKQLRIVRTRHSLPLIAIIMYPPGRMFWSVTNNKYCDGTFPQDYNNLEQAKAACLNLGARCYGIHDYRCGGRAFNLCQSSHLRHSSVGSCVHASPKWTGLFDWESVWYVQLW